MSLLAWWLVAAAMFAIGWSLAGRPMRKDRPGHDRDFESRWLDD